MKKILRYIRYLICYCIASIKYPDIWSLKAATLRSNNGGYLTVYYNRLKRQGSWIGYKSVFEDVPCFPHGIMGVFVSNGARIGKNCVIYQQVTIGSNTIKGSKYEGSPTIGENVLIGSGAKIIGKVNVGNNCRIGANAVVARDVPANSVVVNETRIITKDNQLDNRFYSFQNAQYD